MNHVASIRNIVEKPDKGRVFGVKFVKRTTGEIRIMSCRFGVQKGVTGEGHKYDPIEKGLLTVYDMNVQGFRHIPIDGIITITSKGNHIYINHELEAIHGR